MIRIFTSSHQKVGESGENFAVKYLKGCGYSILGRNIANKYGEIDIVAKKGRTHYFFEVKAGKSASGLNPAENLSKSKIGKFLISVDHYCLFHKITDFRAQAIIVILNEQIPKIEILDLN